MTRSAEAASVSPEVLAKYEPVIGLEVHVQLLTNTKIFCGCSTRFGDAPNANTCPVCLGLPGTLPVLNKRVIEMAARASLARAAPAAGGWTLARPPRPALAPRGP